MILEHIKNQNPLGKFGKTPLHLAASMGHLEICQYFVGCGINPAPKCDRGWTPLHYAGLHGHGKVCQYLKVW